MKWVGRWLVRVIQRSQSEDVPYPNEVINTKLSRTVSVRDQDWHENLNIAITTANGGKIVTFRRYDHKTDRNDNKIYVIPDDHDFNAELGKLITLESMRG